MLYRLCFYKDNKMQGQTFFAADLVAATEFVEKWERMTKCPVLTLKPVGESRFVERGGRTVLRNISPNLGELSS